MSLMNFIKQVVASEPQQNVEAEEVGIHYITPRILAMGFPSTKTVISGTRVEEAVNRNAFASKLARAMIEPVAFKYAKFLNKYHGERYMVWNLSEQSYDSSLFNNNVIEFKFPGYPSPPLQKLFQLQLSIDGWLTADENNVAVIHCQTGKGRTVSTISSYLAWTGEFQTPAKALIHTCRTMHGTVKTLTIPSQTRYLAYLTRILVDKESPQPKPIFVQRIIMNCIPDFEMGGIRPYVQIFKDAKLVFSSKKTQEPRLFTKEDGQIKFDVGTEIQGDILVRVRHITDSGQKISACRFAFHTGFLELQGMIRFKKTQIDGAWNNHRFPDDFWIDIAIGDVNPADTPEAASTQQFWEDMRARRESRPIPETRIETIRIQPPTPSKQSDKPQDGASPPDSNNHVFSIGDGVDLSDDSEEDSGRLLPKDDEKKQTEVHQNGLSAEEQADLLAFDAVLENDGGVDNEDLLELDQYFEGANLDDVVVDEDTERLFQEFTDDLDGLAEETLPPPPPRKNKKDEESNEDTAEDLP